jgi:hypothetical protein
MGGTVVLTETLIMPEPQAKTLSVLKSILLSQGQFIYHNNALYIRNYYFYRKRHGEAQFTSTEDSKLMGVNAKPEQNRI